MLLQQLFGVVVVLCLWCFNCPANASIYTVVLVVAFVAIVVRCCCNTISMVFRLLHPMLQSM